MFDLDTIRHSLQVPSDKLGWLIHTLLPPTHDNFKWVHANRNIPGLTELRARVGKFDCPWQPVSHFDIPDLERPLHKTLAEIYDQRALEIFNRAQQHGQHIVIMWSGGIDSTSLLSAFIKNLDRADLACIRICCSSQSLAENPYFYQSQLRGKFEFLHYRELDVSNEFFEKNLLLHGDPGDCIFGPSTGKYSLLWSNDLYLKPWQDSRPILYQLYHDPDRPDFAHWYVDMVSDNLLEQQQQGRYTRVVTISDWHWWHYYNFKWQGSLTRPLSKNRKDPKAPIHEYHIKDLFDYCFFASADFQTWSYQNLHTLCQNQMRDHKWEAKQYIFELDGNECYRSNKRKQGGGLNNWLKPLVIDSVGRHWYASDAGVLDTWKAVLT